MPLLRQPHGDRRTLQTGRATYDDAGERGFGGGGHWHAGAVRVPRRARRHVDRFGALAPPRPLRLQPGHGHGRRRPPHRPRRPRAAGGGARRRGRERSTSPATDAGGRGAGLRPAVAIVATDAHRRRRGAPGDRPAARRRRSRRDLVRRGGGLVGVAEGAATPSRRRPHRSAEPQPSRAGTRGDAPPRPADHP